MILLDMASSPRPRNDSLFSLDTPKRPRLKKHGQKRRLVTDRLATLDTGTVKIEEVSGKSVQKSQKITGSIVESVVFTGLIVASLVFTHFGQFIIIACVRASDGYLVMKDRL